MNLLEKGLHVALNTLFKRRDVVIHDELYLRRWYLHFGVKKRVFLHYIAKSDDMRSLHDHPWDFTTFIIARGYREQLPGGNSRWAAPFTKRSFKAEHTHAVAPEKGAAWTLVIADPARRVWGFHTATGWKDWRTYLKTPGAVDWPEDIVVIRPSLAYSTVAPPTPVPPADQRPWPPKGKTQCHACGGWSSAALVYCPSCEEK